LPISESTFDVSTLAKLGEFWSSSFHGSKIESRRRLRAGLRLSARAASFVVFLRSGGLRASPILARASLLKNHQKKERREAGQLRGQGQGAHSVLQSLTKGAPLVIYRLSRFSHQRDFGISKNIHLITRLDNLGDRRSSRDAGRRARDARSNGNDNFWSRI
jgi:hypothetical protein